MQPSYMPRQQQQQRPTHQRSATAPSRRLNYGQRSSDVSESWIEVTSGPSDTSSDEHIITSGLRIAHQRRRGRASLPPPPSVPILHSPSDSELSDASALSDDDDDLASTEPADLASFIATLPLSGASSVSADDEHSSTSSTSSESESDIRTVFATASSPPRLQSEHDAALRASLSTLLSCAAAARGLPPKVPSPLARSTSASTSAVEGLRVVRSDAAPRLASPASSEPAAKKRGPHRRVRRADVVQAGFYTLAFSAGAVVVLGAITFSAGYWVGKEVGRGEVAVGVRGVRRVVA
ncbi:hypothetical protein EDC01DRAFT_40878 [Geopyxis carbonaria]|nr:hypothetical protein EDC01DRAFT_40878 [Geopyxis carbonaria]